MKMVPAEILSCSNEIYLNKYGEAWETDNYIKPYKNSNAEICINVGNKEYLLASLMVCTFKLELMLNVLINNIEVLYIDGDKENIHLDNLTYRYKNYPIEDMNYPGYYYIPFHEKYSINTEGNIINNLDGKNKKWYCFSGGKKNSTGGYSYTRVNINGKSTTIGLHRALCLTFKEYGENIDELVVNHIDGNPKNNTLDNLELVTRASNNQHAYDMGLRPNAAQPIFVKNVVTGEITRYVSISECWRKINFLTPSNIWHRACYRNNKLYPDMLMFKFDDGTPWPEVPDNIITAGISKEYVARNVFTGEIKKYSCIDELHKDLGVLPPSVRIHCRKKILLPLNGYNFRYPDKVIEWPNHTPAHLRVYKKHPKNQGDAFYVIDVIDNTTKLYTCFDDVLNTFKISKTKLFYMYKKNKLFLGRYRFVLFELKKELGPPIVQIMG